MREARTWTDASEPALVVAARARDQAAFAEIVRRRQSWLRSLLKRLCGDAALADDLSQETFLRAWRRLGDLEKPLAFAGWLRRIAVTIFLQSRRRAHGGGVDALEGLDLVSDSPAPDLAAGARIDLERALELLSEAERICVVLNFGEGLSHGDIAELAGLPLGTVKSHISRGVVKLRRVMGAEES